MGNTSIRPSSGQVQKSLIISGIIFCLFSNVFAYSGGTGEPNDPYQIADANDLLLLAANTNDYNKYFILTDDIDLAGYSFTKAVIAADVSLNSGFQGIVFTGTFDGSRYKITGLTIDVRNSCSSYIGLFGKIGSGGVIKNLGVEDCNIIGTVLHTPTVHSLELGGLVGYNYYGTIIDCYCTGSIQGYYPVGGLVGTNDHGSIQNCFTTVSLDAHSTVGGLVGYHNGGSIRNCFSANGSVAGYYAVSPFEPFTLYSLVGGLVGRVEFGSISRCYAVNHVVCYGVNVGGNKPPAGGLLGYGYAYQSFWDTQATGVTWSAGGTGKTTEQMQDINTFLAARWDFAGETANGTEDIWTICNWFTYPKFVYQNAQPIADAGPNQTVYAWLDGIAEIELDGSASSDIDECNGLSYHWTWTIDANTYEANGVNPVIELPVGIHTIELIVNDGIVDSEPNYVDVNVIAPLETSLRIMPRVVNRASNIRNIIAVMDMPKGIKKGDISKEPFVLYPADGEEGIEAVRQYVLPMLPCWQHRIRVVALFDKDDLTDLIPNNGRAKLQVVGELTSGQCVFGEDTIWLIGKRRPFWPWCWHK